MIERGGNRLRSMAREVPADGCVYESGGSCVRRCCGALVMVGCNARVRGEQNATGGREALPVVRGKGRACVDAGIVRISRGGGGGGAVRTSSVGERGRRWWIAER
jgi:hypothetical protein